MVRGPRTLLIAIALATSSAGCLRNTYDLCERDDPHPECDAGRPSSDAGVDGGADEDAGESDPMDADTSGDDDDAS